MDYCDELSVNGPKPGNNRKRFVEKAVPGKRSTRYEDLTLCSRQSNAFRISPTVRFCLHAKYEVINRKLLLQVRSKHSLHIQAASIIHFQKKLEQFSVSACCLVN